MSGLAAPNLHTNPLSASLATINKCYDKRDEYLTVLTENNRLSNNFASILNPKESLSKMEKEMGGEVNQKIVAVKSIIKTQVRAASEDRSEVVTSEARRLQELRFLDQSFRL